VPPLVCTGNVRLTFLAGLLCAGACFAQEWEVGGFGGYGWYHNGTIYSPTEKIDAGIRNRFAVGFVVCENLYQHFSGEFRYVYQDGHPFISGPGFNTDIQGSSHTFTYDLLFEVSSKEHRFRPFFAAGAGGKYYVINGPEPNLQPVPAIASLLEQNEWKFVGDFGGGFKYRFHPHVLVRVDFRDYLTSFPHDQIAPAKGNTARGIFQMFTPMFGVSAWF